MRWIHRPQKRLLTLALVLTCLAMPAAGQDEDQSLDDIFAGFEEEPPGPPKAEAEEDKGAGTEAQTTGLARYLDLTGAVSLGASYNLEKHRSSIGPDFPAGPGTDYSGVQRLRTRLDIQADVDLPHDWKGRLQAFGFYDFAYLAHGRDAYTQPVLDDYEAEAEILDFWVEGNVTDWLDLKLGRQVVNWGRSESLRVTDIWNALNNREPGMVDIEELRLPATMARADAYFGNWQITALIVPEIRYDYNPPPGSDFFPLPRASDLPDPPPGAPSKADLVQQILGSSGVANEAPQWGAVPEYGAALTGVFSGWDVSLYAARVYQNQTSSVVGLPDPSLAAAYQIDTDHDRITFVGGGMNYTTGAWLLKLETAFLDELDYTFLRPNPQFLEPTDPAYVAASARLSRIDWMAGLEYYGLGDTSMSLDLAHRHVLDYDPALQAFPNYVYENSVEVALRISSEFFNARLRGNLLGIVLANEKGFQGGLLRLWLDYEIAEALIITVGYIDYFGTDQLPFDTWEQNSRIFSKLKYSFP
ncbi:MAG: DUF1302 family protein [Myxococcota bacterium]|nr:DUF1302 family protein [Myxococcota bacterium]